MKIVKLCVVMMGLICVALFAGCASDAALKDTVWTPVKLENQGDIGLLQDHPVWFQIDKKEEISGNAGVNSIRGTMTAIDENALVFGRLMTTRKGGPNLEYETFFLKMLDASRTYRIEGDNLFLYDNNGDLLATFAVAPQTFNTTVQ